MTLRRARGPVMLGIEGHALSDADRRRLADPLVGGVILFTRNYADAAQLRALTASIRALRDPPLLIAVDHEGGRVQRFRTGFTAVGPMRGVGVRWDEDPAAARDHAFAIGSTIARELRAHGVDFSFTPVLDLDHGASAIIGDRAFHREPAVVGELAGALVRGLHAGGSAAVGKHFPGHGYVAADSHLELPVDDRPLEAVLERDIAPFASLAGTLDAVMPGHVVYPRVDPRPAGFSSVWVGDILRARLGFDGLVVSDDLEMGAAQGVGDIVARADAAVAAGCDMVLVCNRFDAMDDLLARWSPPENARLADRMAAMAAREIASDAAKS
ncbi:MAG TPA: beta-N-acetylhexosaminidase [Casimicrobiaceae bacterium]|jgi:beta-N-acetylhexosaminidase|nr:beta-N-acetylhexosaminidase [Casimicrobiaceae bacterium]